MATYDEWKGRRNMEALERIADSGLLLVDRPLLLHDQHAALGPMCTCGCNSRWSYVAEHRPHLKVLIDPLTGARIERGATRNTGIFDDLASRAKQIYLPRRCSRKQLEAIECGARIFGLFGGVRFGKTRNAAEETGDEWCRHGGHGAKFWWVAPTLAKTQIGIEALALGGIVGKGRERREVQPVFPPELVVHVPSSPDSKKLFIELIDGTKIWLKYASRDGGNLKGEAPIFIVGDEFAEVKEEANYKQILDRLSESRGRFFISTTPKAGSFIKDKVYLAGQPASEWDGDHQIAWIHATAHDNPWFPPDAVADLVKQYGEDEQGIRREIYGEWVGDGPLLWRHLKESDHVVNHPGYKPVEWDLGLVNITEKALGKFFRMPVQDFSGMDFDVNPMSFAPVQVCTHKDLDPDDKANWIFVQYDEVIDSKSGTIHRFADNLESRGFGRWPVACDPSGAQLNPYRLSHGVDPSSTHAEELERRGFRVEPCHRSSNGRPKQPPIMDRVNVTHKLMYDRIQLPDKSWLPRWLIHKRCARTLDCFRVQEADEHGMPIKEPGTESDRIAGPTEANSYASWVVFQHEYQPRAKWN